MTSSASSLTMISMLLLFKCITRFSPLSLEEIKLIAMVNWIFHVSYFLRFMMPFKYGLILLRCSSTDSVLFLSLLLLYSIIITPKITNSHWFIIILFFFMLKKISNISKYSIFNYFTFLFWSKNISHTSNCGNIYFFFQSKKISYIFNSFSFLFLSSSNFECLLYVVEKKLLKKVKVCYASL